MMQSILLKHARMVTTGSIVSGDLLIEKGKIAAISTDRQNRPGGVAEIDLGGSYVAPGFIDLHTHGGGGADFMDGTAEAFVTACEMHLAHGTTTIFPTTLSASFDALYAVVDGFRSAKRMLDGRMNLPGLHFEGPYFNVKQCGAQDPRYIKNPDPAEYRGIVAYADGDVARWSAAAELPGALEFGDYLRAHRILPSIGHSDAEYAEVLEGFRHGYTHVTHLYSGMSSIVRKNGFRYLGVVESAYAIEEMTAEVIADGRHIPPELLRMVYRLKGADRICLITDSICCTGLNVKTAVSGGKKSGQTVIIEDGVAKMPDRQAFAGSIATADRLLKTAWRDAGIPLVDAVKMLTLTPARIFGLDGKKGSIDIGKDADLVVFDGEARVQSVLVNGAFVHRQKTA
jgi:N-acetylglucosamine-6-phosphate deacetylase